MCKVQGGMQQLVCHFCRDQLVHAKYDCFERSSLSLNVVHLDEMQAGQGARRGPIKFPSSHLELP